MQSNVEKTFADGVEGVDDGEDEPRLKYVRLGSSCADLLSRAAASCMQVEDKMIALGTQQGGVHLLDYNGNEIRRFDSHKAAVNDLSFDAKSEFIASCSDDGSVAVHSLFSDETTRLQYSRPIKTVALDPNYSSRKDRQVACAGLAGQLVLNSRGWLGPKDIVLHKGEGPIQRLRWSGSLIAWANDKGIKVYDTAVHHRIGFIERPRVQPPGDHTSTCSLFWESDTLLYIGWGSRVLVARIVHEDDGRGGKAVSDDPWKVLGGPAKAVALGSPSRYVEIVADFGTDYIVAGVAPFGHDLAILAYVPAESAEGPGGAPPPDSGALAARPELRIVSWDNQDIASDALSLHGFEHYAATDYSLAAFHPMVCRGRAPASRAAGAGSASSGNSASSAPGRFARQPTKWWSDGLEPLYYVVSPKDIVLGRPRDGEDRVAWMLEKKRFEEALRLLESGEAARETTREKVAQAYLEHLFNTSQFERAASLCPRLLQGNAAAWERWVYMFARARQLPALAPHIPVEEPRLRSTAYEVVLTSFLPSVENHAGFLSLVRSWPSSGLYNPEQVCGKALARLGKYGGSPALEEAVAELYKIQWKYEEALEVLLGLGKEDVFDFIEQHGLLHLVHAHVMRLMQADERRALGLLVDCWEAVPPKGVVAALRRAEGKAKQAGRLEVGEQWRRRLHSYLHGLFLKDPEAAAEHHGLQVELYADFDPAGLMYFLAHSQQYPLEEAYETCRARGLVKEMVYILGRMGNAPKALCLIIDELQDVPQAVQFVYDQRDDELWDVLISHAISSPDRTAALLEDIGSYCNPLRLLNKIPEGMEIPGLRDRLVKILTDFRSQTSLREGCNNILQSDCINLTRRLYSEIRSALRTSYFFDGTASDEMKKLDRSDPELSSASLPQEVLEIRAGKEKAKGASLTGCSVFRGLGATSKTTSMDAKHSPSQYRPQPESSSTLKRLV